MGQAFRILCIAATLLGCVGSSGATDLLALLDTGELYRSSDKGATWSIQGVLPASDAIGLSAASTSANLFLASRSGSIYRSTDGGASWAAVGAIAASDVAGFTIGPFGAVLALTSTGTLYSSSDQGVTFTAIAVLTGSDWVSLSRGPLGRLYALSATGQVAESRDQGVTWNTVGVVTTSNAVAIHRLQDNLYILAKTGEIYRSLNYGRSWTTIAALTSSSMGALVDLGSSLVAAAAEGEVASSPDGATWTWVGALNQMHVTALATDTPMVTGVAEEESGAPRFLVRAPYPNPSRGAAGALFSFSLPVTDRVRVSLYDARGRRVASLPEQPFARSERNSFRWNPRNLSSGAYFVRFETASGLTATTKWAVVH